MLWGRTIQKTREYSDGTTFVRILYRQKNNPYIDKTEPHVSPAKYAPNLHTTSPHLTKYLT